MSANLNYAPQGTASTTRMPEIASKASYFHALLNELHDAITKVEGRFETVLSAPSAIAEVPTNEIVQKPATELGAQLHVHSETLQAAIQRLGALVKRCEL